MHQGSMDQVQRDVPYYSGWLSVFAACSPAYEVSGFPRSGAHPVRTLPLALGQGKVSSADQQEKTDAELVPRRCVK